jgi:hypothetical protein
MGIEFASQRPLPAASAFILGCVAPSVLRGAFGLAALAGASVVAFFGFYALAFLEDESAYYVTFLRRWQVDPHRLGVALLGCAAVLGFAGLVAVAQALRLERRT